MIKAYIALLIVVILWGSSFPVIKIVVGEIGGFRYVWVRGLIATLSLTPLVFNRFKSVLDNYRETIYGGLLTGAVYCIGLLLQGVGTGLTTASNSAFITGLNVLFVHIYVAFKNKSYETMLGIELVLGLSGLYLLTTPTGGLGFGDILVLLGAVAWAAQVLLVSRYGGFDPLVFTWSEMLPSVLFIFPDMFMNSVSLDMRSLVGLLYLGVFCSAAAFALQAYGQRSVKPEIASLTYLLEPVTASFFSYIVLGEIPTPLQVMGAFLIMVASFSASKHYIKP